MQLLAVLENRDLAAAEVENKGTYEQAQAAYGLETSSALPEEWQKAELDLKTAKETYDAQQKVYDSRRVLFQQGALPRKQLDESAVALIQAKAQYEMAEKHLSALQSAGKQQQMKSARGQLTSAKGQVRRRRRAACLHGDSQPHRRRGHRSSQLSRRDASARHSAADHHGHVVGDRARPHSAERGRRAEAG